MKVSQIFSSFYPNHCALIDYLDDIRHEVCKSADQPSYTVLLQKTIVCYHDKKPKKISVNVNHGFGIEEIIQRIIKIACHSSRGSNVLSLGYEIARDKTNSTGCGSLAASTIVNEHPNSNVRLLQSKPWQTLYERVGDDLMVHLLKDVSLFVLVGDSCYMQVSGNPMYNLEQNLVVGDKTIDNTSESGPQQPQSGKTRRQKKDPKSTVSILKNDPTLTANVSQIAQESTSTHQDYPGSTKTSTIDPTSTGSILKNSLQSTVTTSQGKLTSTGIKAQEEPKSQGDQESTWIKCNNDPNSTADALLDDIPHSDPVAATLYPPTFMSVNNAVDQSRLCKLNSFTAIRPLQRLQGTNTESPCGVQENPFKVVQSTQHTEFRQKDMSIVIDDMIIDDGVQSNAVQEMCHADSELFEASKLIEYRHDEFVATLDDSCVQVSEDQENAHQTESQVVEPSTTNVGIQGEERSRVEALKHTEVQQKDTNKDTVEKMEVDEHPCQKIKKKSGKRKRGKSKNRLSKKQRLDENNSSKSRSATRQVESSPVEFTSKVFKLYFPRQTLMYSSNLKDRFPKNHITSTTPYTSRGLTNFIRALFIDKMKQKGEGLPKQNKVQRVPRRFLNMKQLFENFLRRHKRCRFVKLLNLHCSSADNSNRNRPASEQQDKQDTNAVIDKKEASREILEYENAVKSFTPPYKVCQFVKAVCNLVLPKEFWGTDENKKAFYKNLQRFITLRKGEVFSLGQMVDSIKPTSCGWLKLSKNKRIPPSESEKQKEVLYRWIWWLVRDYIMVILKSFFYITEGANQSKEIFYYRKPIWRIIQDFGIKTVTSTMLRRIPKSEVADLIDSNASLGYSSMRFLPKASTVRPIVNMSTKHSTNKKGPKLSINSKLRNLFEIIKFENTRKAVGAGSSVFGVDDVYSTLKAFIAKRSNIHPLCFVHVDIYKCFDSIILERLYSIMKAVFKEEEYIIKRFVMVKGYRDGAKKAFEKRVTLGEDCRTFQQFAEDIIKERDLKNMVFIDQVWYIRLERCQVLEVLKKHLFENIVKIGNSTYKQIRGIAQGSILSSYLCSHFYTHMEIRYLKSYLKDDSSLLIRWVDDFLYMTPDQSKADTFLTTMNAGIPKYGCQISTKKTLVNYTTLSGIPVRHISQDEAFPWCGFLVNPKTLDVKVDYSRYQDVKIKYSFARSLHSHPGRVLFSRLSFSVRNKCHPLLLDLHINSEETVFTNFYEMFFWLAWKFYWWCRDFPKGRQVTNNHDFLSNVILSLPRFVCSSIKRKFQRLASGHPGCMVEDDLIKWIFYQAFIRCLKTKPLFKAIVKTLRKRSRKLLVSNPDRPTLHYTNPFLV